MSGFKSDTVNGSDVLYQLMGFLLALLRFKFIFKVMNSLLDAKEDLLEGLHNKTLLGVQLVRKGM